jgi:hypothetical protein
MGQTLPSHSALVRINVCFSPQATNRGQVANDEKGHVWTVPAVQEESDFSAKRSGAAMYTACFRLEGYLCRDAAAVAAGPDVIR